MSPRARKLVWSSTSSANRLLSREEHAHDPPKPRLPSSLARRIVMSDDTAARCRSAATDPGIAPLVSALRLPSADRQLVHVFAVRAEVAREQTLERHAARRGRPGDGRQHGWAQRKRLRLGVTRANDRVRVRRRRKTRRRIGWRVIEPLQEVAGRREARAGNAAHAQRHMLRRQDLNQPLGGIRRDARVEQAVGVQVEQRRRVRDGAREVHAVVIEILIERERAGAARVGGEVGVLLAEVCSDGIARLERRRVEREVALSVGDVSPAVDCDRREHAAESAARGIPRRRDEPRAGRQTSRELSAAEGHAVHRGQIRVGAESEGGHAGGADAESGDERCHRVDVALELGRERVLHAVDRLVHSVGSRWTGVGAERSSGARALRLNLDRGHRRDGRGELHVDDR